MTVPFFNQAPQRAAKNQRFEVTLAFGACERDTTFACATTPAQAAQASDRIHDRTDDATA